MKRFSAPLALALLLALPPARAADDTADAPAASPAPAALNWRVAPADATPGPGSSLSGLSGTPSRGLLRDFKMILEGAPDSKARAELSAVVDDMIKAADEVKPSEQQIWIDNHLGELNAVIRHLSQDAPKAFAAQAAAQAAALNNRA